jgi:hypothetical protein
MLLVALVPPGPVQSSAYVSVAGVLSAPIVTPLLDVGCVLPSHPSDPEPPPAVQDVALFDDQLNTIDPPAAILLGAAVKLVMVAAGVTALTVTVTDVGPLEPPAPVQVNM